MCGVNGLGGLATSKQGLASAALGVIGGQVLKGKSKKTATPQQYGDGTTDPATGAMS